MWLNKEGIATIQNKEVVVVKKNYNVLNGNATLPMLSALIGCDTVSLLVIGAKILHGICGKFSARLHKHLKYFITCRHT